MWLVNGGGAEATQKRDGVFLDGSAAQHSGAGGGADSSDARFVFFFLQPPESESKRIRKVAAARVWDFVRKTGTCSAQEKQKPQTHVAPAHTQ